jgi:hypothetical protein
MRLYRLLCRFLGHRFGQVFVGAEPAYCERCGETFGYDGDDE